MKASTDIWFCAYLLYRGEKIHKYDAMGRGKVKCYFDITEEKWAQYKLDFNNSDVIKFKAFTEQIKDLGY